MVTAEMALATAQVKAMAQVSRQSPHTSLCKVPCVTMRAAQTLEEHKQVLRVLATSHNPQIPQLAAHPAWEYRHTDEKRGAQETHLIPGLQTQFSSTATLANQLVFEGAFAVVCRRKHWSGC